MKKTILAITLLLNLTLLFAEQKEIGIASWYTADKPNALTANGEIFDNSALSAAHKSLTFGSIVEVKNIKNGKSIQVRINDRGPYVEGRIIDLTGEGAKRLDFYDDGIANVELTVISIPKESETKYISGAETGWYALQIGSYTNIKNAYSVYTNIRSVGLKPTVEVINDSMIRISVKNIQSYKLEEVRAKLSSIGITEPLIKGNKNPYN